MGAEESSAALAERLITEAEEEEEVEEAEAEAAAAVELGFSFLAAAALRTGRPDMAFDVRRREREEVKKEK